VRGTEYLDFISVFSIVISSHWPESADRASLHTLPPKVFSAALQAGRCIAPSVRQ
jgi:hypothetical protein